MRNFILQIWKDFVSLIYPDLCCGCNEVLLQHERLLCLKCRMSLPKTGFHKEAVNPISKLFYGRVRVEAATALCRFSKKGMVQNMVHQLKYKSNQEVGVLLGNLLATEIKDTAPFNEIDFIIPVPLHLKKLKKRGYNQAECVANGYAEISGKPVYTDVLIKTVNNQTQTKRNQWQRWLNVEEIYTVKDFSFLQDKTVLLVDDVITTGSTLEACIATLQSQARVRVCVAAVAYA